MSDIVLTTLNAKFIHAAFGLRYLMANLGALRERARIIEFDINQRATDVVEALLAREPKIIGIGVYIWNAGISLEVTQLLKRLRPEITIILGGPEVSYETAGQPIAELADYVITGEADLKFAEVCGQVLAGEKIPRKIIAADVPDLAQVVLPYDLYDDRDVTHRIIYVEASRGCPFTCEFCLSSLEIPVRQFSIEPFLASLQRLLDRGVQHFKFVDRTFNLNLNTSKAILDFFIERLRPGLFLHFEMIPDRLPEALREIIAKFPPGALQFEVGIQTFNAEVSTRIKRRQNYQKLAENFHFLRQSTGVHIHADLIVGLPGESVQSFGKGLDKLLALAPQEIQIGILKRLRGTPIVRHDLEWRMVYSPFPPYEILCTRDISFEEMQQMRRFSRHWDLYVNSGNFVESAPLIWTGSDSPFVAFLRFSSWLFARTGRNHSIALAALGELLFEYLTVEASLESRPTAKTIFHDYRRGGRSDIPMFLRPHLEPEAAGGVPASRSSHGIKRQSRHLAVNA